MRTSYSALNTYKTCPLKFKFEQLDKIRVPKGVEAVFGSAIHASLKFMFDRTPLYPELNQIIDFFRNTWDQRKDLIEFSDEISAERKNEYLDAYYKEGISLLEKFYKKNQPWNFNVIDMESRFGIELEDPKSGEKHTLAGIIDRIDKNDDETYEIIDYKTAKKMPSQQIIDNDLQMSIYHLALVKQWPHISPDKIKMSFYFIKHGEKISTSRTPAQLENTKQLVMKMINEIEEKIKDDFNFPPTPSVLCDWCGHRQMCPMWKHLYAQKYEREKIKNQDELEGAMEEYFKLKDNNSQNNKRLGELKTTISNFMEEQKVARVFSNEGYITKKTAEKFSYDLEKIKEILQSEEKWNDILVPDEKKIEAILPSLSDESKQKIIANRSIKQVSTLYASKSKGGEKEEEEN